jgi:hypothetical protein
VSPLILLAPGAGAPSSSAWMRVWAERLSAFGRVVPMDYAYAREGRRRPDPHEQLVAAHRTALAAARTGHDGPVVLAGKSMGGRIGCHVSLLDRVDALVCLGYPLRGASGKLRDEVLLGLGTPVLFVQGTRDELCDLGELEDVRSRMTAPTSLHVVEGGDHSLRVTATDLRRRGETQADVDARVLAAIATFVLRRQTG